MKIDLGSKVMLDLDKAIESRILIQANSGGGKSFTIRRFIEQSFGKKHIIVLDPEGEFTNLREKFDFVYCGKDGDAPIESRSASLLAHRLLELKASAILDLYELPPQERKHFVRLFLEAMVNAPKELWHDVFVILDEAHVFAPEKAESESLGAVIDMASRGRKRGFCLIPATQRPAKLKKDVAAECHNKLIGRASLDIDRKRAAEELGFTTKEQVLSLRDLEPGEFYAFGPALSREVIKFKVGDVKVKPPKRSETRKAPPKPSAKVKEILSQLADLPQEAKKEAQTVAELKKENAELKRQNTKPVMTKEIQDKWYEVGYEAGLLNGRKDAGAAWERVVKAWVAHMKTPKIVWPEDAPSMIPLGWMTPSNLVKVDPKKFAKLNFEVKVKPVSYAEAFPAKPTPDNEPISGELPVGEKAVLIAAAQYQPYGIERDGITTITGYKRSTRDAYIKRLADKGFVDVGANIMATDAGIAALGDDYRPLPTGRALREHLMATLPKGEKEVLYTLISARIDGSSDYIPRDYISTETGFKRSTRDAYISRLMKRRLVEGSSVGVRGVSMLFSDV